MAGELILYTSEDGGLVVRLQERDGSVWLSQLQLAELFQTTVSNINRHIRGILDDYEQDEATVEEYSTVQTEGKRSVERPVAHYSLPMILSVGFRVRSPRGAQFRRWAAETLSEYMIKGFAMDDDRLKEPDNDYFEELLARIRDIRASEKLFYQKVRDLYTTAIDYDKTSEQAQAFFKKVQNKMLWAVTGKTAAGLIENRSDPTAPNMDLTMNMLDEAHVGKVLETYPTRAEAARYSHNARPGEIAGNGFNLNIPRYVDTFKPEDEIDVAAVQKDILRIEAELAGVRTKMAGYLRELGVDA